MMILRSSVELKLKKNKIMHTTDSNKKENILNSKNKHESQKLKWRKEYLSQKIWCTIQIFFIPLILNIF